jgi:hypothetical protein
VLYFVGMVSRKPRVWVTLDDDLAAAVAEFGERKPRSRVVRDLALRGAEAIRKERTRHRESTEFPRRLDSDVDVSFNFSVAAQHHAERR